MFIWGKDDLTTEQENAVKEPGNVLLIACPGSGKTRTLTYKIAFELSKLTSKKRYIIAITYTNNAAEEIKHRIELLGVDISQLWIGTIHAFCTEWILRPYGLYHPDLKFGFRVFNSHESEVLLNTICSKHPIDKFTSYDCSYMFTAEGYVLTNASASKRPFVIKVLEEYWQYLSENQIIDFELILYYSFELLRDNPVICKTLNKIFSHFLVDEFQDTKDLQYEIVSKILKSNPKDIRAFVVGDPNQSIYGSLGGYAIEKDKLESMSGCVFEPYELSENFRSSIKIIQYFDYFKTFPNKIVGKGKNKDYQSIISYNQTLIRDNLEKEIARLILYNINDLYISPNEICVVAPQWIHLASLTRNLMVRLPDYSFNGPGMAPFARDIDNFFFKLCRILLTEPAPNIYVSRFRWASEIISELNKFGADTSQLTPKAFLRDCNSLDINETEGLQYLEKAFIGLFKILNISINAYPSLINDYNSFFESSTQRIERLKKEGNEFISTIENFKKVFKQRDGITVSSMHGVKGLEFDTVIAFGLLESYVPHGNDPDGPISAKKLLYVIASRAKLNLHLISERRIKAYPKPPREMLSTIQLAQCSYKYDAC